MVVWYSHLFKNIPQFAAIHRVKGFGIVNKAEIYVFLELSCFFDVSNLISVSSAFPYPVLLLLNLLRGTEEEAAWHRSGERRYPMSKVRSGSREEFP